MIHPEPNDGQRPKAVESPMYDDDYATCARTHATLLMDTGEVDPSTVTDRLGIDPTHRQRRGELVVRPGRPTPRRVAPVSLWSLTSRDEVDSRDSRRHIDWLLDHLASKGEAIRSLQEEGCQASISCSWTSRSGHGGPIIPPAQMRRLIELNIELWFDFDDSIGEEATPADDAESPPTHRDPDGPGA